MQKYDENIVMGEFYKTLKNDNTRLLQEAVENNWMICIPRRESIIGGPLTEDDMQSHILVPDKENANRYTSLSGVKVRVKDGALFSCEMVANILFAETVYDDQIGKFIVHCIDRSLGAYEYETSSFSRYDLIPVNSVQDCCTFMCTITGNDKCLSTIDYAIDQLRKDEYDATSFDELKEKLKLLYQECLNLVLMPPDCGERIYESHYVHDCFKLALENYVMSKIYNKVFSCLVVFNSEQDEQLNRTILSLCDIIPEDLGIPLSFKDFLPEAKMELANISLHITPMGKIKCLKRCLGCIKTQEACTSDATISVFIYLIIKVHVPVWCAILNFLKLYPLLDIQDHGEIDYYISTLEAALKYIMSELCVNALSSEACVILESNPSDTSLLGATCTMNCYFDYVKQGCLDSVISLLSDPCSMLTYSVNSSLCHPLCSCSMCSKVLGKSELQKRVSLQSRNEYGQTGLHCAALYGRPNIVEYFIQQGAEVNARDIKGALPVHCAAQKGHRNALLLLLNAGCDINVSDNNGNTPLHLAVQNGHTQCVKAILFFSESSGSVLHVNAQNSHGDTPLHLACQWGYYSVVQLLLDRIVSLGLSTDTKNRRKLTPRDCSQNLHIVQLIEGTSVCKNELITTVMYVNTVRPRKPNSTVMPGEPRQICTTDKTSIELQNLIRAIKENKQDEVDRYLSCYKRSLFKQPESQDLCHPLCQCSTCITVTQSGSPPLLDLDVVVDGYALLHLAVMHTNQDVVRELLQLGANPNNVCGKLEQTPLHLACARGCVHIVEVLIAYKIDVSHQDILGNSALHICVMHGHEDCMLTLLKHGANTAVCNKEERTPSEEAELKGHWNLVQLLLKHKQL